MILTKRNKIKGTIGDRLTTVIIYIVAGCAGIITLLPFLYIVAGSFATEQELTEKAFFIVPTVVSLNAYKYILDTGEVFTGLKNSLFLTVIGTAFNMFFTTTFAYPLSKRHLKGRNVLLNIVIITMLFNGGMIPMFLWVKSLGLYNSYWSLILMGAISPFNMIIVKNFFQEIPQELEDAGRIDGCSDLIIFTRIILPLSKPVLASISLFYAVGHWNNYFGPMIYLSDTTKETVQIVLRRIVLLAAGIQADGMDFDIMGTPPDKAVKMAATVVATMPILIAYPFVQGFFTKGVMVGAVKG